MNTDMTHINVVAKFTPNLGLTAQRVEPEVPGFVPAIGIITGSTSESGGEKIMRYLRYRLSQETDRDTAVGYMTTILGRFAPSYAARFENGLMKHGFKIEKIPFRDLDAGLRRVPITEALITRNALCVLVGQLCFLPFKNFNDNNYITYMENRTRTLCQRAGLSPGDCSSRPVTLQMAIRMRDLLGSCNGYRQAIIEMLMDFAKSTQDMVRNMAGQMLGLLAWTEMNALIFVHDTLIKFGSPVLCDYAVRMEVKNVCEALLMVEASTYPQYYKVYGEPTTWYLLERNRFVKLFCIALGVNLKCTPSMRNFISNDLMGDAHILELVELHVNAANLIRDRAVPMPVTQFMDFYVDKQRLIEDKTKSFLRSSAYTVAFPEEPEEDVIDQAPAQPAPQRRRRANN